MAASVKQIPLRVSMCKPSCTPQALCVGIHVVLQILLINAQRDLSNKSLLAAAAFTNLSVICQKVKTDDV